MQLSATCLSSTHRNPSGLVPRWDEGYADTIVLRSFFNTSWKRRDRLDLPVNSEPKPKQQSELRFALLERQRPEHAVCLLCEF